MTNPTPLKPTTAAFFLQAVLSFGVALVALVIGIAWLPVEPWTRAFLAIGVLYLTTSTFTLAKIVRDQQERADLAHRLDEARAERLLKEHDPFASL